MKKTIKPIEKQLLLLKKLNNFSLFQKTINHTNVLNLCGFFIRNPAFHAEN